MAVDSKYLYRAKDDLNALSRDLLDQETQAAAMRVDLVEGTGDVLGLWKGPRATSVLRDANDYLRSIKAYPDGLKVARGTLKRWASAASDTARALAVQEEIVQNYGDQTPVQPDADFDPGRSPFQDEFEASAEMDRIRAAWGRTCTRYAEELDGAIGAIARANDATFLTIDPGRAEALGAQLWLQSMSGPDAVRTWWNGLSDAERLALLMGHPGTLGNLDGLPASIRDIANRTQLMNDLNRLEELESTDRLSFSNERELTNIRNVIENLEDGADYRDPITGEPVPCQLYIYEPAAFDGDGRVAISTGDLDAARHIALTVPGLTTNVAGMDSESAQNLYDETRWASGAGVAVLNWQAYNTPDLGGGIRGMDAGGVVSDGYADAGAELLASDVDGLNGMRDDDPHVTVVAHSYGSTTAAIAANHHGLAADDVVLIGSPGAGYNVDGADDFTTGSDHTWIGSASNDPVTYAPNLGPDPAEEGFGGTRFTAENDEPLTPVAEMPSHTAYYDDGSESLHNISSVVAGEYDQVVEAPDREPPVEFGAPSIDVEPNFGPFGMPGFPDIDIDGPVELNPEYLNDPERGRDPVSMTHNPPEPGGPTRQR